MDVTLPDGTVIKGVPDGTTKEQLAVKLKAKGMSVPDSWMSGSSRSSPGSLKDRMKSSEDEARVKYQKDTLDSMGVGGRLAAGAGKAVYDTARGIGQVLGVETKSDIEDARKLDENLMSTTSGKIGNALGYMAEAVPASIAAGSLGVGAGLATGGKMLVGAGVGGAQGYAAPYTSTGEHVANTLTGAGLGAALPGIGGAVNALGKKLVTPEARALLNQGVELTPGQKMGGFVKTLEDKLTSVPLVGSAIKNAQQRSRESFSMSGINQSIESLGRSLPKGISDGRQALTMARDYVSEAYEKSLKGMTGTLDNDFNQKIVKTFNTASKNLPKDKIDTFDRIVENEVYNRFDSMGKASGNAVKNIRSELGSIASKLGRSENYDDRALSTAVKDLQSHVDDMLKRQNSVEDNSMLLAADNAHAKLLRVEEAAGSLGNNDGLYTPAQLKNAVKSGDDSLRKRNFTQGRASMQGFAEAGQKVIPSSIPNSGTADRLLAAGTIGGFTGTLPLMAATGGIAHAVYSRPGQALISKMMQPRLNPVTNYLLQLSSSRLAQPQQPPMIQSPVPQQ